MAGAAKDGYDCGALGEVLGVGAGGQGPASGTQGRSLRSPWRQRTQNINPMGRSGRVGMQYPVPWWSASIWLRSRSVHPWRAGRARNAAHNPGGQGFYPAGNLGFPRPFGGQEQPSVIGGGSPPPPLGLLTRPVEGGSGLSAVARAPVALGGPAQDPPQNTLGDSHMMVIGYELEYGQTIEVTVAGNQVREHQILGDLRANCPTCHVERPVTRVQLQVR